MKPDKEMRVQALFERGHRMMDKPAAPADVKPHIIALRGHAVDIACGNAHQPGEVGSPEFLQPLLRFLAFRRMLASVIDIFRGPVERPLKPGGIDGLHQVIDRRDFESRDRELIEGGDKHDCGRGVLPGQRPRDLDPVQPRHGDIEKKQVGRKFACHRHRGFAIARDADQPGAVSTRKEKLEPLGRERLVVGNQHSERIVLSHGFRPA